MTRRSTRRSSVAVRRTVLGLMLGIPLVASPVVAQEATPGSQAAEGQEVVVGDTVGEVTAVSYTHLTLPTICSV